MVKIINDYGRIWAVEITENVNGKMLVTFYDTRHEHTALGQPVSTYYAETIAKGDSGLNLQGGVEDWQISQAGMTRVREWLDAKLP
jgi:hypothetical protein